MIRPSSIPEGIVETDAVRIVREAAYTSQAVGYATRIVGVPGTGKSTALWHVAKEMGGSYCEITGAQKNIKSMYELLLRSVGAYRGTKYISDLAEEAFHSLSPRTGFDDKTGDWGSFPRIIFVDEIQTLELTAFRELLRVQERCHLTLVLAGNAERLAGSNRDKATLSQIESRILPPLYLPGPSARDCELIGTMFNVEGKDAYKLLVAYGMATNFRALVQLLEVALRLTADISGVRSEHIQRAIKFMKPNASVLKRISTEAA